MEQKPSVNLYNDNCLNTMGLLKSNFIDLTVTSPPYDNLRTYNGSIEWNENVWKSVISELFRITKDGGIVVWVIGDSVVKGSETGTSFRQALFAIECGFNLHDTMIYAKDSFSFPMNNRCHQVFEYMFVFSKGTPKTFNVIKDRVNKSSGTKMTTTDRQRDGSLKKVSFKNRVNDTIGEFGGRFNIWTYNIGNGKMGDKVDHPAVFPEKLAQDNILCWSNEGDTVFDPFLGSGTVGKMAILCNRNFIGCEKERTYFTEAVQRINKYASIIN